EAVAGAQFAVVLNERSSFLNLPSTIIRRLHHSHLSSSGESSVKRALFIVGLFIATVICANGQVQLIAIGSLTSSSAGVNADLSGLSNTLENVAPANLLGGLGSGMTWA